MSSEIVPKPLVIIQARMGSTRLPRKVLLEVQGIPLLEYEIKRIQRAKQIGGIVVATTVHEQDVQIENLCNRLSTPVVRGSVEDVLDRYMQTAQAYPLYQSFVRLTGDCPLMDPAVVDEVIVAFEQSGADYASNVLPPTFPDGIDVEVFTRKALEEAHAKAKLQSEREHVTPYINKREQFKKINVTAPADFSALRLTVDQKEDFELVKFIIEHSEHTASYLEYVALFTKYPDVFLNNMHIARNEGYAKSLREDKEVT